MKNLRYILAVAAIILAIPVSAQVDRHDVRTGNRKFRKGNYKESEISYRKALVKDSTSFAANFNLANTLYRQEHMAEAQTCLEKLKEAAPTSVHAADYYYNLGNVALKQKNYQAAVDAYKHSLLVRPDDMDAKENYIYAKKMLDNQKKNGGGGGGNNNKNQDNKQNQNKNNQGQNNQQNQNQQNQNNQNNQENQNNQNQQNQNQNQQPQQGQQNQQGQQPQGGGKISPQQAQQMLQAVQAKEKETQDKVKKEKAKLYERQQREKNW